MSHTETQLNNIIDQIENIYELLRQIDILQINNKMSKISASYIKSIITRQIQLESNISYQSGFVENFYNQLYHLFIATFNEGNPIDEYNQDLSDFIEVILKYQDDLYIKFKETTKVLNNI